VISFAHLRDEGEILSGEISTLREPPSEREQIVSIPRHIKNIMQMDGDHFTIDHHIDINIAAAYGLSS
jgi:hypothetical protein